MAATPAVVVIKKKRHGHHGHHGGAWKVAYADFVTAMMAFFLVMWIVGQSKAVKAGVAGYFRDPSVLDGEGSNGILPGHTAGLEAEGPTPREGGKIQAEAAASKVRAVGVPGAGAVPSADSWPVILPVYPVP